MASQPYRAREEKAKENQRVIKLANSLRHVALRVNALVVDRDGPNGAKYTALCVHVGRGNEQSRLSTHAWMCITFEDGLVADKAMARRFAVSPKSIRNSIFLMASVILDFSRSLSNRFIVAAQAIPSCGMSLTAAMWNLAWDETSRLLTLPLPGALRAAQRRSSWHVCVSTSKFDVVYTQASTGKM